MGRLVDRQDHFDVPGLRLLGDDVEAQVAVVARDELRQDHVASLAEVP